VAHALTNRTPEVSHMTRLALAVRPLFVTRLRGVRALGDFARREVECRKTVSTLRDQPVAVQARPLEAISRTAAHRVEGNRSLDDD
jgi:hypothetical protein